MQDDWNGCAVSHLFVTDDIVTRADVIDAVIISVIEAKGGQIP